MAIERTNNGNVPVDALLAALRRAAEDDGVEDVDAVVAEFATFVRAQAPQLASSATKRRQTSSWTTAVLTAGALTTAAMGAAASGLVAIPAIPLFGTDPSDSTGDLAGEATPALTPDVGLDPTLAGRSGAAATPGDTGVAGTPSQVDALDGDALAVIESQQTATGDGTVPVSPGTADPTDATGPTDPSAVATTSTTDPDPTDPDPAGSTATSTTSTTSTTAPPSSTSSTVGGDPGTGGSGTGSGSGDVIEPLSADPDATADSPALPRTAPDDTPDDTPQATVTSLDDQGGAG